VRVGINMEGIHIVDAVKRVRAARSCLYAVWWMGARAPCVLMRGARAYGQTLLLSQAIDTISVWRESEHPSKHTFFFECHKARGRRPLCTCAHAHWVGCRRQAADACEGVLAGGVQGDGAEA
jgi:hypothetical protein